MRRDVNGIGRRIAGRLALLLAFGLCPATAEAGLRLVPVGSGSPAGDVRALASAAGGHWAGTVSGVFRGTSLGEGWAFDGLAGKPVLSVAVLGDETWAATGEELWRRSAAGEWSLETLPSPVAFPTTVGVDASGVLWVGGLGAWRRTGGAWTAAPSPGAGIVTAMLPDPSGLVVGLSAGIAARWTGGGWVSLSGGVGPAEGFRALASFGGTLWAGTNVTLYAWNGSSWVADAAFGGHDVRALTAWGGALRAATADAGVRIRSGSAWTADRSGLLPRGGQAFLDLGSELLIGTAGGGVYRRQGSGWTPIGGPRPAAVVTAVVALDPAAFPGLAAVASLGGGAEIVDTGVAGFPGGPPALVRLPDGCGEATAISRTAVALPEVVVATSCGPYVVSDFSATVSSAGLSPASLPTTLASHAGAVFGGTATTGLWRFSGASWSAEPVAGYTGTGTVNAVRSFGGSLWVAMAEGLFARGAAPWADVSAGLPGGGLVVSLGGDAGAAFAGLTTGGVYRRPAGSFFRRDSAGLNAAQVFSLDLSGGRLWAAAGRRGVALKRNGAWGPETAGLPAGASVTVVRNAGPAGSVDGEMLLVGTAGHGTFVASARPGVRTLPVVLDVVGAGGARFLSEIVVGSRAAAEATFPITFTPAPGFAGAGGTLAPKTANIALPPGRELRAADALAFLRSLGMSIPVATPQAPVAGSVTLGNGTRHVDDAYLVARTYTAGASGGTFGLFYDAPSDLDAAEEEAAVYGLRSVPGAARSNLAVVHLPGRGAGSIEVSVQVHSASGAPAGEPLVRTLAPGEWTQWNGVLGLAGLPDGAFGYAKIRRTGGVGAFAAYGVVNDAKTSDGSYLPAYRPGGLSAARTVVVPVVLDVYGEAGSHYTTEVTLVNDGSIATPVDLVYRPAPGFGEIAGVGVVTVGLAAREQVTLPDVLAYLRSRGMQIPDGTSGPQAGTLTATFRFLADLDAPSTVVLARTTTPNTDTAAGGAFGLFYPGVAKGGGARTSALVPGLAQDDAVRSNLAVVNLGGEAELPVTLEARLYDADTGAAAGSPLTVSLAPGAWHQWSRVHTLAGAPASVKRFTAVVRRLSGSDTFLAYGVLNDAVTSDGSFQAMISSDPY
jgi:hypothetical protein